MIILYTLTWIPSSAFGWASKVQKLQRFVRPFGWASEVWKNQVSFGRSGGLPKYRNPKDSFGRSGGLPKYGKTKFRSDVPKNGKISRFVWVCFRVPKNGKIPRFDLVGFRRTENQETKIRSGGLPKNENPKIRSGGLPKNENPKIRSGGLPKNENPKIKIRAVGFRRTKPKDKDSCGGLPTNENPKIKIRSGGFRLSKERKKLKIRFSGLSKNNGKPRFIWCLGWVLINRKKPKILSVGFQKIKIRKYIRIHELCDCGIVD
ncbi:uncharacterized protein OCT59_006866 [Rhizophagus irregularis]|uniref:uncharacterized protein n=1 Tax=Rhizophagus irregularis TaxID=588596 RepID=UPI00332DD7F6|nr:hypothetical protein OCT59_006866 [Rhizophagus irregularis]